MLKLWRRAMGKIKDRNTIWMVSLARKSKYRQSDLEATIIKATSHDDSCVDYKNAQRVFTWVRISPSHLIVFLWAITQRVKRTRSWSVALKSLILFHGVLCTKASGVRKIGRLPFDLSSFVDAYTHDGPRKYARNQFVQAYFSFLDLKSVILSADLKNETAAMNNEGEGDGVEKLLGKVKRWQDLLDLILEVRPYGGGIADNLVVLEAMDCMVIEVFELYSQICDGIATTLMKIYGEKVAKSEASTALDVLQKASRQGQELSDYFQLCRKIGLLHEPECPKIQRIPEADFSELKRIINGAEDDYAEDSSIKENKIRALVVVDEKSDLDQQGRHKPWLKSVITDKWEVFEEEIVEAGKAGVVTDPFAASLNFPPATHYNPFIQNGDAPSHLAVNLL